jgi:hypothetical protein
MHLSPLKLGHRQRITWGTATFSTYFPILVPSKSTWTQHRVWGSEALFPSKQQPKKLPKPKNQTATQPNTGPEHISNTQACIKKEKTKREGTELMMMIMMMMQPPANNSVINYRPEQISRK